MLNKPSNFPCENCITLSICNERFLSDAGINRYRGNIDHMRIMYPSYLYDLKQKCFLLDNYIKTNEEKISEEINKINNFFIAMNKEKNNE